MTRLNAKVQQASV